LRVGIFGDLRRQSCRSGADICGCVAFTSVFSVAELSGDPLPRKLLRHAGLERSQPAPYLVEEAYNGFSSDSLSIIQMFSNRTLSPADPSRRNDMRELR
jgi:hypothetical protein